VGDASAEREAVHGLRRLGDDYCGDEMEERESAGELCRRRLELLFLDAKRRQNTDDESLQPDGHSLEGFDPALEALIQRIVEEERRYNTLAGLHTSRRTH
jgi:hypothetical protein